MFEVVIIILLVLSFLGNVVLFSYSRSLVRQLIVIADNFAVLIKELKEYSEHLKKIYTSETYYGDDTLMDLLKHSEFIDKEVLKMFIPDLQAMAHPANEDLIREEEEQEYEKSYIASKKEEESVEKKEEKQE